MRFNLNKNGYRLNIGCYSFMLYLASVYNTLVIIPDCDEEQRVHIATPYLCSLSNTIDTLIVGLVPHEI